MDAVEAPVQHSSSVMNALPVHRSAVLLISCQLNLDVGGGKSISHGATAGLCQSHGAIFFSLFTKSRKRLVSPISPSSLPSLLIKYGAGMLVLAEPTGNWTFSLTFHINSFIKLCQGLATLLEVYLERI